MSDSLSTGNGTLKLTSSLNVGDIAWSNDGRILYVATKGGGLYKYNPANNTLTRIASNLPSKVDGLDMRPDELLMSDSSLNDRREEKPVELTLAFA